MRVVERLIHGADVDPLKAALECHRHHLTRGEVVAEAGALADALRAHGAGPDSVVGLVGDRGCELTIGMLGVWLTGAAWVPLDPELPPARLALMVEDLNVTVAVGTPDGLARAGLTHLEGVPIVFGSATERAARVDPAPPDALAYVIFTSGSTGRPKPVGITRACVDHLVDVKVTHYRVDVGSRVAQFASASFDVAVAETAMWLAGGGVLVSPPEAARIPGPETLRWLDSARITHLLISPSALGALPHRALPRLRVLGVGGEVLPASVVTTWGPGRALVNGYGPTETTVWATCHDVDVEMAGDEGVDLKVHGGVDLQAGVDGAGEGAAWGSSGPPIGSPFDGVTAAVFMTRDRGDDGELVIGGAGVARGYLGMPGRTAAQFVPDPQGQPGSRRYRTGDIVRRDGRDLIHFVGRVDDQVKIRGFRVEPGEVTQALRDHPEVSDAVTVVDRAASVPRLVGYAVSHAPSQDLVDHLRSVLPSHLMPSAVVTLDALPLTSHGKVDTGGLPRPERRHTGAARGRATSAGDPLQVEVAELFEELIGIDGVGVDDDFFGLGGHSLLIGRLVARVRDALGVELSLADVLSAPTVRNLAALIHRGGRGPDRPSPPPITSRPDGVVIPLTFQQERVWFLEQFAPHNLAYNTQASFRIRGALDPEALRGAIDAVVARHEVLRTRFVDRGDGPVQEVISVDAVDLPIIECSIGDAESQVAAATRHVFNLMQPPLARWWLLRHGEQDHTLVQVEHHFVHDGWSFALLMRDLIAAYDALSEGRDHELTLPELSYADYAVWQRQWMRGNVLDQHRSAWRRMLSGAPMMLDLPADRHRPKVQSFAGDQVRTVIPEDLVDRLAAYSRGQGRSLFATMLAGFAVLLERLTEHRDLLVGTGSANRHTADVEGILGMLVNTLVLRVRLDESDTFDDVVGKAAAAVADAYTWPDVPTDEVVRELAPGRDASSNPLFQVMFSFHDSPVPDYALGEARAELTERHNGSAKADLNVVVIPRGSQRRGREHSEEDSRMVLLWEYATDLFDRSTMERLVQHYLDLLSSALDRPSSPALLLVDGGGPVTGEDLGGDREAPWSRGGSAAAVRSDPLAALAEHTGRDPEGVSVEDATVRLTRADVWQRAQGVADALRHHGLGPEDIVAVHLHRSADWVVAQVAILMAGCAFVPLDPSGPLQRARRIVDDSGCRAVISLEEGGQLWAANVVSIRPDTAFGSTGVGPSQGNGGGLHLDAADAHPLQRAYVMYTSGSTGDPKGVEVSRGNLASMVRWFRSEMGDGMGEPVAQTASLTFDASVMEVWGALTSGSPLVIAPDDVRVDPPRLREWLHDQRIVTSFVPTAVAESLLDEAWPQPARLRLMMVGGMALSRAPSPDQPWRLVNCYGPTEATVVATRGVVTPEDVVPTIGTPSLGATSAVVRRGRDQPGGLPGELYVGGSGVARGYLGEPGLTAERFVPDPHGAAGSRRYRTGDQVVVRGDGRLSFRGRRDRQIQLRGHRVELGEVTAALTRHPGVEQAAATIRMTPGGGQLVGYVVGDVAPSDVRATVAMMLPSAIVPASITVLDRLPITASGKLDEAALPEPHSGPQDEPLLEGLVGMDAQVARIWGDLLASKPLRARDDFFLSGGHSLLATRLMSQITSRLGRRVDLAAFFADPTFGALCLLVAGAPSAAPAKLSPGPSTRESVEELDFDLEADVTELVAALAEEEGTR